MGFAVPTRRIVKLGFILLTLALVSSAGATTPGTNGRIAFTSTRDGNAELYSVAPDGTSLRRLTWTSATEQFPAWSSDGIKIAYESAKPGGHFRIWVMNADGSAQTQITSTTLDNVDDSAPVWSPDGSEIAFGSTRSGTWNIWVIRADGTGLRRVTSGFGVYPSWSPDGTQLVYSGLGAIAIVNADGTNAHPISGPGTAPTSPSWSPDGTHILFARNDASGFAAGELYIANTDGSGERPLTTDGSHNAHPRWSPDGSKVVFVRSAQLWSIGADGLGLQQVLSESAILPDWGTSQVVPEPSPPEAPIIDIWSPSDGQIFLPGMNPIAFYVCSSFVSPVVSCVGDVPVGAQLDTSYGTHTFTVRAVDNEGRTASDTVTYTVPDFTVPDFTPPLIDLRVPTDGATYELDADVRADYSCSDPGGSGIAQCQGNLPSGAALDTDNAGQHVFTVAAYDKAGHQSLARVVYTVVDRRPPRIEIGSPFPDLTYPVNTAATASYYCWSPGGVWIVSCIGTVPSGDHIPAASVGPRTFTVTAQDANGKTTTRDVPYVVVYSFQNYEAPVDADGFISGARAGDGVALKFSLSGDQGLNIVSKTLWQPASCADWTTTGSATSADAKLSYSASTDRYRDVVATSSAWKGTCRILRLTFADSISRDVRVRFK
jgi:Tol biopolymer transport system component